MDLVDYLRALRKHWILVVLSVLLGGGAGYGAYSTSAPVYRADCLMFVSMYDTGNAALLMQGSMFTQQRVQSYTSVLESPKVLAPVIRELGLDTTPAPSPSTSAPAPPSGRSSSRSRSTSPRPSWPPTSPTPSPGTSGRRSASSSRPPPRR